MSALAEWPGFLQYPTKANTELSVFDADIKGFARYAAHTAAQCGRQVGKVVTLIK